MRALLLHDTEDRSPFADALAEAGYEVVHCTQPGADPAVCRAVDGTCPLDAPVDVAVAIHDRADDTLVPGEFGIVCARRDGIPIVATGRNPMRVAGGTVEAVAGGPEQLADACAEARRVADARNAVLVSRAAGTDLTLERQGDVVRITLNGGDGGAAVRAHRAARTLYPKARSITIN